MNWALRRGAKVRILDDLSRVGSAKNIEWLNERHGARVELVRGSTTDAELCRQAAADVEAIAQPPVG